MRGTAPGREAACELMGECFSVVRSGGLCALARGVSIEARPSRGDASPLSGCCSSASAKWQTPLFSYLGQTGPRHNSKMIQVLLVSVIRSEPVQNKVLANRRQAGLGHRRFHRSRRSAARNVFLQGMPEEMSMSIMGHKTRVRFDRYNIVTGADQRTYYTKPLFRSLHGQFIV